MIVVIGAVAATGVQESGSPLVPSGLAARIALAAAGAGSRVEIVTRIGEDPAGDGVLLAFAAAGVGHVATLRDAAHATPVHPAGSEQDDPDAADDTDDTDRTVDGALAPAAPADCPGAAGATPPTLDAADVGLALRYLDDYRVIVVVHPSDDGIVREVVAATAWASAHLVVVAAPGSSAPDGLPVDSVLISAPDDAEGVATLLGRYATAVDAGEEPAAAFRATLGAAV